MDEDGYYVMKSDEATACEGEECDPREPSRSSSSAINDEVIKFHIQMHRESIEEQRLINRMADEYEQKRVYREMMKKENEDQIKQKLQNIQNHFHQLQSSFHYDLQLL